jgi:hypothetical protein
MARRLALALLVLALLRPELPAQGKLERARQEVTAPKEPDCPPREDSCDDEGDSFFGAVLGGLLGAVVARSIQDKEERPTAFLPYPYAHDYPGYLWRTPPDSAGPEVPRAPPAELNVGGGAGRAWLDNGNDFDGLNRLGGQLFLDTSCGLGLRLDGNWLHERLTCGCRDDSFLGSALLTYRLCEHKRFQFHLGLGCVVLSDRAVTKAGVDFSAGFDLFPVRPVVLSGLVDVGGLGSATYTRARFTVGYLLKRWEVFAGYDYQATGDVELRGPLAGVRLWF